MTQRRRRLVVTLTALAVALALAAPSALGVHLVRGQVGPLPTSARSLEDRWTRILDGAVRDGVVDYARLGAREAELAQLVDALGRVGPDSTPDLFPERADRLAYEVNAYNALVAYAVVSRRVRGSVRDVHGPIEPASGMGFFWALRFTVDGRSLNLHDLENDVIRARFSDARIHAAVNCASRSCPALVGEAYRGPSIDAQLDAAATRFASEAPHVVLDESTHTIRLSQIYTWYESDFVRDASRAGRDASALGWIRAHATRPVSEALATAVGRGDAVQYVPYDWSLNGHW